MRIVMDFRKYDGVVGGVEQGTVNVARLLCERGGRVILICKLNRMSEVEELLGDVDGLTIVPVDVKDHGIGLTNARVDSGFIPKVAEQFDADLVHFFYNWSFPFSKSVPTILTVHDVIPFTFREAMGWWRNHFLYRPAIKLACRLNNLVTTVSDFSRRDISQKVGIPLEKIRVVPNGLREPAGPDQETIEELRERFGTEDGFVLNVGGIHERKNIFRLIEAFSMLVKKDNYPGKLLITGSVSGAPYQNKMKPKCDAAVAEHDMQDRVVFTGFVSDDELDHLLRDAQVLAYPSLYEGFGIPVLEALKADTPVVTSEESAMAEVAGEAAVLIDPHEAESLYEGLSKVLGDEDLQQDLVSKGKEVVKPYTWEACCDKYTEIYEELIEQAE